MSEQFIRICKTERRMPLHRVPVEIGGHRHYGFLLASIDQNNQVKRDTLVLTNPEEAIHLLPALQRDQWQAFSKRVSQLRNQWGLQAVPTLKKIVRLYRRGEIFSSMELATVAYHHGAVPVLVIGETEDLKVALLSQPFGHGFRKTVARDLELIETLSSLDEFLPFLLHSYYEQIANYLMAVFFTADEKRALNFCLRVRELIARSIREKIDLITLNHNYPDAEKLAAALREKFTSEINKARAVDALGHLIVNYIYGFFCVRNRAIEYSERLQSLSEEKDLFEEPSVEFMKRCGEIILDPDDGSFLENISGENRPKEKWLHDLAQVSAFVSEVVRSTKGEYLLNPRIFVTHHFNVVDSDRFFVQLSTLVNDKNSSARLIRGRHLGRDIRWALLARIWLSDFHVLFLPNSWQRSDGKPKSLRGEGNWVDLELFYGQLIKRSIRIVVGEPFNPQVVDDFIRHVGEYTNEREIEQISEAEWREFVGPAKEQLKSILRTTHYLKGNTSHLDEAFWREFQTQVMNPAARKLINILFHAWCYYFNPRDWSIVQAMMLLNPEGYKEFTVPELEEFIREKIADPRFAWARSYNKKDLKKQIQQRFHELSEFEFTLYEGGSFAILPRIRKKPLTVKLRLQLFYNVLAKKFDLEPDAREFRRIVKELLEPRKA